MHVLAFFFVSILGMEQRNLIKSVIIEILVLQMDLKKNQNLNEFLFICSIAIAFQIVCFSSS
jgi:hypothetical protein